MIFDIKTIKMKKIFKKKILENIQNKSFINSWYASKGIDIIINLLNKKHQNINYSKFLIFEYCIKYILIEFVN